MQSSTSAAGHYESYMRSSDPLELFSYEHSKLPEDKHRQSIVLAREEAVARPSARERQ